MVAYSTLLPGTIANPEHISFYAPIETLVKYDPYLKNGFHIEHHVCAWNQLGYVPLLSIISGIIRAVLGLFHLLSSFAYGCLELNPIQQIYVDEYLFALRHLYRGVIETIPFLGNAIAYHLDSLKNELLEIEMKKVAIDELADRALLFLDNRLEASLPLGEFNEKIFKEEEVDYQTLFFQSSNLWLPIHDN
jgi:hypothetical protein